MRRCEYCGNTSGKVDYYGNCISCGAPLVNYPYWDGYPDQWGYQTRNQHNNFMYMVCSTDTPIDFERYHEQD